MKWQKWIRLHFRSQKITHSTKPMSTYLCIFLQIFANLPPPCYRLLTVIKLTSGGCSSLHFIRGNKTHLHCYFRWKKCSGTFDECDDWKTSSGLDSREDRYCSDAVVLLTAGRSTGYMAPQILCWDIFTSTRLLVIFVKLLVLSRKFRNLTSATVIDAVSLILAQHQHVSHGVSLDVCVRTIVFQFKITEVT